MKRFFPVLIGLSLASHAGAATKTLTCTNGSPFQSVGATLDDSKYQAKSGFFDVKDASVQVEFASAKLNCVGHTLAEIRCVGFWFGSGSNIAEVSVQASNGGYVAVTKNLTPSPVLDGMSFPCQVK